MAESAEDIGSFVTAFLNDFNEQIAECIKEVTGEVENTLHQRLKPGGDKKKQAFQLNTVAKCSQEYMTKVHNAFEKNFDKFALYMRRNLVAVPADITQEVAALYAKRQQEPKSSSSSDGNEQENGDDSLLSKEGQQEHALEKQLATLRQRYRELTEANQQLQLEQKALETKTKHFQSVAAQANFLEQVKEETVLPYKRAVEYISSLKDSVTHMEGMQATAEEDTQKFKRAKMATRDTYRNLRKRFMARATTMTFTSTDDLTQLNAKLLSM